MRVHDLLFSLFHVYAIVCIYAGPLKFLKYAGSLTTPTCNEAVTWVVMNKVATITTAALDRFHDKVSVVSSITFLLT